MRSIRAWARRGAAPCAALLALAAGCRGSAGDGGGTGVEGTETGSADTASGTEGTGGSPGDPVGSADCADAPVEIAARAGDVRKVCLYADGQTCVVHADDPAATSCAVHPSLLNFEWNLGPPEERRLLELFGWTAVSYDQGRLEEGQGIEPDAIVLTDLPLGTPITVAATHDDSGATYELTFAFGADTLTLTSVSR